MSRRVLVDCDVILDLLLAREPHFEAATRLFLLIQERRLQGFVSPLSFSNLFYILRKAMPASEAVAALRKLKVLVHVLPVDERIVDLALSSSFGDLEDALHYYTATVHGLDALVTRNKRDYKSPQIPILSAAECVEMESQSPG